MKSLRDVLRWGLYAVVGLFALIGLSSVLSSGSRQTPTQQAPQAAAGPEIESTAQARVAATVAIVDTAAARLPVTGGAAVPTTVAVASKPQNATIPTVVPTAAPTAARPTQQPAVRPPATPTVVTLPSVGESAQSGNWAVNLMKVEPAQALGTQFSRKQAQGIFVVLTVAAANLHNQTSTLNSWDFQMLGPSGVSYKFRVDALVDAQPGFSGFACPLFGPSIEIDFRCRGRDSNPYGLLGPRILSPPRLSSFATPAGATKYTERSADVYDDVARGSSAGSASGGMCTKRTSSTNASTMLMASMAKMP
jgi:hypothetical protein